MLPSEIPYLGGGKKNPLHPDLNQQIIHVTHLARCLNLHSDEVPLQNEINILIFITI